MGTQYPAMFNYHMLQTATPGALSGADNLVVVGTGGTGTYTLPQIPSSATLDGEPIWVKNSSGSGVTVAAHAGDTIEAGYTTLTTGQACAVICNKATGNWVGLVKPQ